MVARIGAFRAFPRSERLWIAFAALLLSMAPARSEPALAQPAPGSGWTDADKWAWSKIESGQEADFDKREKCAPAPPADPEHKRDKAWDDPCRKVSAGFLQDILTKAPWREATPFKGVFITHAKVDGDIDLENARLVRAFGIRDSLFDGAMKLMRAKTDGLIGLVGSLVSGMVNAASLHSGVSLLLMQSSFEGDLLLIGAKVAGQISIVDASVSGTLKAEPIQAHDMFARGTKFEGDVKIIFSEMSNNLDLRGAELTNLNLSNTSIGGELSLAGGSRQPLQWKKVNDKPAILNLRNAHVGGLVDTKEVWPSDGRLQLRLEGLKLDHLGGFEGGTGQEMRERGGWWDEWVRLDPDYSPAPYAQLVAVMKAAGDSDAADDIQFLGRERAREAICTKDARSFNCALQNVLGYAVGYGIGKYSFFALSIG